MSPKKLQTPKSGKKGKVSVPKPVKVVEPESEDEDSDDEAEDADSDDSEILPAKEGIEMDSDEEDDDDDDDDSEDETEVKPIVTAKVGKSKTIMKTPTPSKKQKVEEEEDDEDESDDESDDDSEDEEEEMQSNGKRKKKQKESKGNKKTEVEEDSDDDDDDDDDEDDSEESEEEEEEMQLNGKRKKKEKEGKGNKKSKVEEDSDDDDDDDEEEDDDDDSEDDEEEDEEEEQVKTEAKQKKKKDKKPKADQKAKVQHSGPKISIMIRNIPTECSDKAIIKFLKDIPVTEVRTSKFKQFAFVDLENPEDEAKALALSGSNLKGNTVSLEIAKSKNQKTDQMNQKDDTPRSSELTLFVKNLDFGVTKEMIEENFSAAKEIRLPTRPDGSLKGFCFLEFSSEEELESALKDKQGAELNGRAIYVDYAGSKSKFSAPKGNQRSQHKSQGQAGTTKVLFVKNLSFNTDGDSLQSVFEGSVSARVATDRETHKSRGFGFVTFETAEAAQTACESMNHSEVDGREITLDYATELQSTPGDGGFRRGGGRGGGGRGGGFRGGRGGPGRGRGRGGRGFRRD